ncbi:hypothetical protein [Methylocystis suflitae]|uniref:hypothetical protein n=1 Tax=Methylocystis suflitae TaxID=2951405 RepID=UPI00210E8247|nr:hypothetical protein [Methylocystis suflitae]MCQ4188491.1 hypothetical protein [Methylocystis suflitae]
MIETLIGLIFLVIIIGVFWWAATTLLRVIPLAEPFRTVVHVLVVLVGVFIVLYVAQMFLSAAGIKVPWPKFGEAKPIHLVMPA